MKIRRSIATALAAGTVVLSFGLAAPAHAHQLLPNPQIQINPCVLIPGSCTPPKPTVPKGPGDLTADPCIQTGTCPTPTVPPTTDPKPDDSQDPATPAPAVHAAAAFTG